MAKNNLELIKELTKTGVSFKDGVTVEDLIFILQHMNHNVQVKLATDEEYNSIATYIMFDYRKQNKSDKLPTLLLAPLNPEQTY